MRKCDLIDAVAGFRLPPFLSYKILMLAERNEFICVTLAKLVLHEIFLKAFNQDR